MFVRTVADNLKSTANEVRALLDQLKEKSAIYRWYREGEGLVFVGKKYSWQDLDEQGRVIQSKAVTKYVRYFDLIRNLLTGQPSATIEDLMNAHETIQVVLQQNENRWRSDLDDVFTAAGQALDTQHELLNRLFDEASGLVTLVPDTNALLANPCFEEWNIDEARRFSIALTPPVLAELDKLKVNHRSEAVREKTQSLIRRIKEYRRRGKLTEGVTLVGDKSEIMAFAAEPKMDEALAWLDEFSSDDRILASTIEVIKARPHSPVVLVTGDINLQNKAEFAGIPNMEPPGSE